MPVEPSSIPASRRIAPLLLCLGMLGAAQATATAQPHAQQDAMRFDVVSIRSSTVHSQSLRITKDGFEAIGTPLKSTLEVAYAPAPYFKHLGEIKGLPAWVTSERYDLKANVAAKDVAQWQALNQNLMQDPIVLKRMLRLLLAERCNLRMHSVPVRSDALALRVAANAPALATDTSLPKHAEGIELADGAVLVSAMQNGQTTYTVYNVSMPLLASFLTTYATARIEDRTGLKGRYRFVLHHIPPLRNDGTTIPVPFLLQDAGLTVEPIKVNSQRWLVDHIDKPTKKLIPNP